MESLHDVLKHHGINTDSLAVLRTTDRGAIQMLTTPGGDVAIELWRHLRSLVNETAHWPVIIGSTEELEWVKRDADFNGQSVSSMLAESNLIDGGKILADRDAERREEFVEYNPDEDINEFFAKDGEWPTKVGPNNSFLIPFDITTRKSHREVAIGLVPTTNTWEVPVYLGIGSWNECPGPGEHLAIMKRWNDQYGAEIVGATHDTIEMHVSRPPADKASAMALAREQYTYCADIVEQGTETIAGLAAPLLKGSVWFFWWD